jgi:hypothetical protein
MHSTAANLGSANEDRIRRSTAMHLNDQIDRQTHSNIQAYVNSNHSTIRRRIRELDQEWDIERVLEVKASTIALAGLALGLTRNRRWLALPAAVMGFLLQHAVQGWSPPLALLRSMGIRTRGEIDREKYELIALIQRR